MTRGDCSNGDRPRPGHQFAGYRSLGGRIEGDIDVRLFAPIVLPFPLTRCASCGRGMRRQDRSSDDAAYCGARCAVIGQPSLARAALRGSPDGAAPSA